MNSNIFMRYHRQIKAARDKSLADCPNRQTCEKERSVQYGSIYSQWTKGRIGQKSKTTALSEG
ncbi:hypothetical protein Blut17040_19710 [Blautia luti]|nr:hypothetical protein Blut17040_19710 [Blautia luti]